MARVALFLALLLLPGPGDPPAPAPQPPETPEAPAVRVTNLAGGETLRYPVPLLRGQAWDPDGATVRVVNLSSKRPDRAMETTILDHRFRALVELVPGENEILLAAPSGEARLKVRFRPPTTPYVVRFVYLTDSGGGTAYQSERTSDPQDFPAKIDTAAKLIQSLTAERMNDEGFGRRTFALELDADGRVVVHVVRAPRDASYYRSRPVKGNYAEIRDFLEGILPTGQAKNVVLLAFTRFNPITRDVESPMAQGGGGYAMFGSLGMFAWPGRLGEVQAAFSDTTRVDPDRTNDDSSGRHTYWGIAATTLGAVLHEAGHTFSLPHSADPYDVMTRGFDLLNRAFTVAEPGNGPGAGPLVYGGSEVAGFGRISSPRLAWHRWFEPDARKWRDTAGPTARVDPAAGRILVTADNGLRVVGIDGVVRGGWVSVDAISWPRRPPRRVVLDMADLRRRAGGLAFGLVFIDDQGNSSRCEPKDLIDPAPFVRTWRFSEEAVPWEGPPAFPALPGGGAEAAARDLERQPATVVPTAVVDLGARYPVRNHRAARALAVVRSRGEERLAMLTGSDDALRVWLNGALVLERPVTRPAAPDQDRTEVTLRRGENRILVEVGNGIGGWEFYLRFADLSGAPRNVAGDGTLAPAPAKPGSK